jgi:hypothetical protein
MLMWLPRSKVAALRPVFMWANVLPQSVDL